MRSRWQTEGTLREEIILRVNELYAAIRED